VPGAAANGLLLRGTDDVPPNSPFSQVPQARTIELTGRGGPLRFRFFRMPLRTGAAPTADGGD
jgi:hypothetical protein